MDNVELNKNLQNIDLNIGTADIEMNFETGVQGKQGERGIQGEPGIPGAPGAPGPKGDSGVWVGSTTPPSDYNVWVDPDGTQSTIPTKTSELTNDSGFITDSYHDSTKVDKETGKGLSANDFTNTYKGNVDDNTTARHTHSNKTVLDDITSNDITNWNNNTTNIGNLTNLTTTNKTNLVSAINETNTKIIDISEILTYTDNTPFSTVQTFFNSIQGDIISAIDWDEYNTNDIVVFKKNIFFTLGDNDQTILININKGKKYSVPVSEAKLFLLGFSYFFEATSNIVSDVPVYFEDYLFLEGLVYYTDTMGNYSDDAVVAVNIAIALNQTEGIMYFYIRDRLPVNYGTSTPSGGYEGDIYFQYES